MWEEILSTPKVIRELIKKKEDIFEVSKYLATRGKIYLTGCGTSYNLALVASYILHKIAEVDVIAAPSFELLNHLKVPEDAVIIGISYSGKTKATVKVFEKYKNVIKIAVTNTPNSNLEKLSTTSLLLPGKEAVGPKTKSFTTGILAFLLLAIGIASTKGLRVNHLLINEIEKLPTIINDYLPIWGDTARNISATLYNKRFYIVGAGENYGVALEGALKLMETGEVIAQGFELEEIVHGPIATVVNENSVVVVLSPEENDYERALELVDAAHVMGAQVISITHNYQTKLKESSESFIEIPRVNKFIVPILTAIPLQMLAYWIAIKRNIYPDMIRLRSERQAKALTIVLG